MTTPPGNGAAALAVDATAELWSRLARPFDMAATVDAVFGLSPEVVEQLAGVLVATCDEAEALLAGMPRTLRTLKSAVGVNHERCIGELRGPVQWSETLAAQASSLGNRDVFVCASAQRAFDIDANRVLVAALRAVAEAGRDIDAVDDDSYEDDGARRARHNARAARRYLDHGALAQVRLEGRVSQRDLRRTRGGKSSRSYRPALAMLERVAEPLTLEELMPYADRRTRAQHALLLAVIDELAGRGLDVPALRAEAGSLFAGPVEYVHPRRRGDRSRLHGVLIGTVLVDVPERAGERDRDRATADLRARARGRDVVAVLDATDVARAVDHAILVARR